VILRSRTSPHGYLLPDYVNFCNLPALDFCLQPSPSSLEIPRCIPQGASWLTQGRRTIPTHRDTKSLAHTWKSVHAPKSHLHYRFGPVLARRWALLDLSESRAKGISFSLVRLVWLVTNVMDVVWIFACKLTNPRSWDDFWYAWKTSKLVQLQTHVHPSTIHIMRGSHSLSLVGISLQFLILSIEVLLEYTFMATVFVGLISLYGRHSWTGTLLPVENLAIRFLGGDPWLATLDDTGSTCPALCLFQ